MTFVLLFEVIYQNGKISKKCMYENLSFKYVTIHVFMNTFPLFCLGLKLPNV